MTSIEVVVVVGQHTHYTYGHTHAGTVEIDFNFHGALKTRKNVFFGGGGRNNNEEHTRQMNKSERRRKLYNNIVYGTFTADTYTGRC